MTQHGLIGRHRFFQGRAHALQLRIQVLEGRERLLGSSQLGMQLGNGGRQLFLLLRQWATALGGGGGNRATLAWVTQGRQLCFQFLHLGGGGR